MYTITAPSGFPIQTRSPRIAHNFYTNEKLHHQPSHFCQTTSKQAYYFVPFYTAKRKFCTDPSGELLGNSGRMADDVVASPLAPINSKLVSLFCTHFVLFYIVIRKFCTTGVVNKEFQVGRLATWFFPLAPIDSKLEFSQKQ